MNTPKKRILIIDDEAGFTRLAKMSLERVGRYEVGVSHGSNGAIAIAVEFKPDLILLDVMMPGIDGGDLAARLATHPRLREVPVVFVTAAVQKDELTIHNGKIGGFPFISKPVDIREMTEMIEANLRPTSTEAAPEEAGA